MKLLFMLLNNVTNDNPYVVNIGTLTLVSLKLKKYPKKVIFQCDICNIKKQRKSHRITEGKGNGETG